MLFVEKIRKKMPSREEKEKELFFLLKKINDSAEKAAKYMYENIELWYGLGSKSNSYFFEEEIYNLLDEIVINPETFKFNTEELTNILETKIDKDTSCIVTGIKKKKDNERNGYLQREKYRSDQLEKLIIEWGTAFFIYNLLILLQDYYIEVINSKEKYNFKLSEGIENIYEQLFKISNEADSMFYLYTSHIIENTQGRFEFSEYNFDEDEYYFDEKIKKLPTFEILREDNKYIQWLKDKRFGVLIKELKSINIENIYKKINFPENEKNDKNVILNIEWHYGRSYIYSAELKQCLTVLKILDEEEIRKILINVVNLNYCEIKIKGYHIIAEYIEDKKSIIKIKREILGIEYKN